MDLFNDKELFIKTQDGYIDKEIENLRKHSKYIMRIFVNEGFVDKYPRLFESNCMALAYIVIYIGANHIIPMGMGRWFKRITKEFAQYIYKEYKEPEDKKN